MVVGIFLCHFRVVFLSIPVIFINREAETEGVVGCDSFLLFVPLFLVPLDETLLVVTFLFGYAAPAQDSVVLLGMMVLEDVLEDSDGSLGVVIGEFVVYFGEKRWGLLGCDGRLWFMGGVGHKINGLSLQLLYAF